MYMYSNNDISSKTEPFLCRFSQWDIQEKTTAAYEVVVDLRVIKQPLKKKITNSNSVFFLPAHYTPCMCLHLPGDKIATSEKKEKLCK